LSLSTVAYFGTIFVEFAAATWGWLQLSDLPWVALVTLLTIAVILRGMWWWRAELDPFRRWLGLVFTAWCLILFIGYLMGAADMAGGPLLRKLALLQIALFFAFMAGISALLPSRLAWVALVIWTVSTAFFGLRFMASDYYRGSHSVAETVARLPAPVLLYSNYHTSLSFLLERLGTTETIQVLPFGRREIGTRSALTVDLRLPPEKVVCFSLRRDGGYLRAEVDAWRLGGDPVARVDAGLDTTMRQVITRLDKLGWTKSVEESYPGRVSFRLACLSKAGDDKPPLPRS
jgi:hypothetical protein